MLHTYAYGINTVYTMAKGSINMINHTHIPLKLLTLASSIHAPLPFSHHSVQTDIRNDNHKY
jgi:hypothetical protein